MHPHPTPEPRPVPRWLWAVLAVTVTILLVVGGFAVQRYLDDRAEQAARPTFSDGTYRVGFDVWPGDYSYTASTRGYWSVCEDSECAQVSQINLLEAVTGSLTIPRDAQFIQLVEMTITPE